MGKIYKNQTALYIQVTTGVDITGATSTLIQYRKPSGAEDSWSAEIVDAENGIIKYADFSANTLNESGWWTFWADITFSTGLRGIGESFKIYVYEEGN